MSIRINLLAPERRRVRRRPSAVGVGVAVLVVLVAALAVWTVSLQGRIAALREDVARVQQLVAGLRPQAEEVERMRARLQALQRREELVQQFFASQIPAVEAIADVGLLIPRDSWITEFAVQGGQSVQLSGATTASNESVAAFLVNLERSAFFQGVDLSVSERQRVGPRDVFRFTVTARLEGRPRASVPAAPAGGDR